MASISSLCIQRERNRCLLMKDQSQDACDSGGLASLGDMLYRIESSARLVIALVESVTVSIRPKAAAVGNARQKALQVGAVAIGLSTHVQGSAELRSPKIRLACSSIARVGLCAAQQDLNSRLRSVALCHLHGGASLSRTLKLVRTAGETKH